MLLTPSEWHKRFVIQAHWTARIREYYLSRAAIPPNAIILDVGCGTGALFHEMQSLYPSGRIIGFDIKSSFLRYAVQNNQAFYPVQGDAYTIPFSTNHIDLVYCHYFLLWIADPLQILAEIFRVLKPGGLFVAFAEPDYQGRIDYPTALVRLGELQNTALSQQGVRLDSGRKLPELLSQVGMEQIQFGILGGHWEMDLNPSSQSQEWQMLEHDLHGISQQEMSTFKMLDSKAWEQRKRILYVPTFYGLGYKPPSG